MTTEELLATINQPLPSSKEAEESLIGCLFFNPSLCDSAPAPDQFYHPHRRLIYSTILHQFAQGRPVDSIAISHVLRESGKLDMVGGPSYLSELASFIPIQSHFPYYRDVLKRNFQFRSMIHACASGIHAVRLWNESDGVSATDTLQNVIKAVNEALNDDGSPDLESHDLKTLIQDVMDECSEAASSGRRFHGISTGIEEFDLIMGGLEKGCLTVIAAESSDGKSSLGRQILESAAIEGHHVVDYTYEMMPKSEARRVLCSQGRVDAGNLKRGMLTREEQLNLMVAVKRSSTWDFHVVDVAGKTIEQICRDISRRARKLPEGKRIVAMIDYIQLCQTAADSLSREREIAHITSTAKQCAKLTGAHIIMPSQVNKDGDVRESMAIEQDADNLIKIKKVTQKEKKPSWKKGEDEDKPNFERDIFFHKVRDGERYKTVKSRLTGQYFRFEILREKNQ